VGLTSVATFLACAGIGAYARRAGVLTEGAQKGLDKLISSVYLPCLIIEKVLPNTSLQVLMDVWPLAVVCLFTVCYGLLTGACLGCIAPKFKGMLMVAVAFPNSFAVPITLMLAMGDQPEMLADGQEGGEALRSRVNLLFLNSYALWVLARWSIGYPLLSGALTVREWREKVLNAPVVACIVAGTVGVLWHSMPPEQQGAWVSSFAPVLHPVTVALQYAGRCSVPSILITLGARMDEAVATLWQRRKAANAARAEPLLSACGPLVEPAAEEDMPLCAYFGVLLLRQIIGPLFGVALCCGFLRGVCGVTSPVVLMVGMLQTAGPPMINLGVMSGLSGSAETQTARVLLLTYAFSTVSWTVSITLFLGFF